jgi:hypothetical protein
MIKLNKLNCDFAEKFLLNRCENSKSSKTVLFCYVLFQGNYKLGAKSKVICPCLEAMLTHFF